MADAEEKRVLQQFNAMRQRLAETVRKIEELTNESTEHEMVIKALTPMNSDRKCFRLIGDVLVERTVGETLPAVKQHKEKLTEIMKAYADGMKEQEKALSEFQTKHKIRIVNKQGQPVDEEGEAGSGSSGAAGSSRQAQGVLVQKQ